MTAIEIDAPAAVVWEHVTSFSEITAAPPWYFRTGLAYPLRARLEGSGVGAVRHCEFTTGAFVEPITVWDAPRRLAFDVIAQPPPLHEWSPYSRVYAPHLDGFFRTSHGEFRLVALDGGTHAARRTDLVHPRHAAGDRTGPRSPTPSCTRSTAACWSTSRARRSVDP